MMMEHNYSGHCAMPIKLTLVPVLILVALLVLLTGSNSAWAAEAPAIDGSGSEFGPEPLPSAAEAAYQDLVDSEGQEIWLEEAVFTEISPIAVPEVGIALPADQQL